MTAVAIRRPEFGPQQWMPYDIHGEGWSLTVDVSYRVGYRSIRDRGLGRDPIVEVIDVTFTDSKAAVQSVLTMPGLVDAVIAQIEAAELQDS